MEFLLLSVLSCLLADVSLPALVLVSVGFAACFVFCPASDGGSVVFFLGSSVTGEMFPALSTGAILLIYSI